MRCGTARKHLYMFTGQGSDCPTYPMLTEVSQAKAHVAECDACRKFFESEERLADFIRRRAPRATLSASLREGILGRIAEERNQQQRGSFLSGLLRHRILAFSVLCLLIIGAIAAVLWSGRQKDQMTPRQIASLLVEDHTKMLGMSNYTQIAASDREMVQSWFRGKVDFAFRLPETSDPQLVGARLCNLQGQSAALIFYETARCPISLFVFDGCDVDLPEDRLIALDGKRCIVDSLKGFNVVLWKERGLLYGLVSEVPSMGLLRIAEKF